MAALTRTVQIICLAMLFAVVLAVLDWSAVRRMKIESDLRDCARAVRQSKLMLHDKERLLDAIERLEDRLRSGSQIDFRLWFRHHQTIHEMLDHEIKNDEARLIERELLRTEKDFEEPVTTEDEGAAGSKNGRFSGQVRKRMANETPGRPNKGGCGYKQPRQTRGPDGA